MRSKVNILNRKVKYEYFILSSFNAGIMLTGSEIKSIRNNDANISDCYCLFKDKELFARNIYISEYKNSGYSDHDCTRDRKLLLNKTELDKIFDKVREKGISVVAKRLYINEKGLAKIEISIVKGKKLFDKRNSIKDRDNKIKLDKLKKNFNA